MPPSVVVWIIVSLFGCSAQAFEACDAGHYLGHYLDGTTCKAPPTTGDTVTILKEDVDNGITGTVGMTGKIETDDGSDMPYHVRLISNGKVHRYKAEWVRHPQAPAGYKVVHAKAGDHAVCKADRIAVDCDACGPRWGNIDKCRDLCDKNAVTNGCTHMTYFSDEGCQIYRACDTTWDQDYEGGSIKSTILEKQVCDHNTQNTCYRTAYDSSGNPEWAKSYSSCVAKGEACPCDSTWEHPCSWDGQGNEPSNFFCEKKTSDCPCDHNTQKTCYRTAYDSSGNPEWERSYRSCVAKDEACPCDSTWEHPCWDGSCAPLTNAWQCPCHTTQNTCYQTAYDSSGNPEWGKSTSSCVAKDETCPCDSTWEHQCWDGSGNETFNFYCNPLRHACPCDHNTQNSCYQTAYDSSGNPEGGKSTSSCVAKDETCPCDATWEHRCSIDGQGNEPFYCEKKTNDCPCTDSNQFECRKSAYNSEGLQTSFSIKCVTQASECMCGAGSVGPCLQGAEWGKGFYTCLSAKLFSACPVSGGGRRLSAAHAGKTVLV